MGRAPFQVLVFPYHPLADGEFEYALLKRADEGYWQAIAGGGEAGENPIQAARRETFEETGISTDAPFLTLQTVESIPVIEFKDSALWGEETYVIPQYCFGVLVDSRQLELSHEHTQYDWLSFSDACRLLKFDGNRTALWELDRRLHGGPRSAPHPAQAHSLNENLVFLKLGGSLITDKTQAHHAQLDVLARLADEIATVLSKRPDLRLILGHGSGSFGHVPAKKYGTRQGVRTEQEWRGFFEVWQEASSLNRIVLQALHAAGLPAVTFAPSAGVLAHNGQVTQWNLTPLKTALDHGLLPVIYGDVVFDTSRGGTILSTEDLFAHLARELHPIRLFLAGLEDGVWEDYPLCTRLIPKITSQNYPQLRLTLQGSAGTDVTGGMESKVRQALALVAEIPGLQAWIFSGAVPGNVQLALQGVALGTQVSA